MLVFPEEPVMPMTARPRHAAHDLAGQGGERLLGVGDDDARHALGGPGDQRGDRTPLDGAGDEVVAVGVLADPGDVEAAGSGLARVGHDGPVDDEGVGVDTGRRDDGTTRGPRDLGERQSDHAAPSPAARRSAAPSSARSSKGCTTPPTS